MNIYNAKYVYYFDNSNIQRHRKSINSMQNYLAAKASVMHGFDGKLGKANGAPKAPLGL